MILAYATTMIGFGFENDDNGFGMTILRLW